MVEAEREVIKRKIGIGRMLIGMLEKDPDPRAPEVARILGEQVAELVERLGDFPHRPSPLTPLPEGEGKRTEGEERAEGRLPDVVVGLRALNVKAKRL